MNLKKIEALIWDFCAKQQREIPKDEDKLIEFLNELQQVGLLSAEEKNIYLANAKESADE